MQIVVKVRPAALKRVIFPWIFHEQQKFPSAKKKTVSQKKARTLCEQEWARMVEEDDLLRTVYLSIQQCEKKIRIVTVEQRGLIQEQKTDRQRMERQQAYLYDMGKAGFQCCLLQCCWIVVEGWEGFWNRDSIVASTEKRLIRTDRIPSGIVQQEVRMTTPLFLRYLYPCTSDSMQKSRVVLATQTSKYLPSFPISLSVELWYCCLLLRQVARRRRRQLERQMREGIIRNYQKEGFFILVRLPNYCWLRAAISARKKATRTMRTMQEIVFCLRRTALGVDMFSHQIFSGLGAQLRLSCLLSMVKS